MQPYTGRIHKVDDRKCLYSEIRANAKARKTAARRNAKQNIIDIINI